MKAKRPIITVAAVDVQCPECKEFIAGPSGALFFAVNELRTDDLFHCDCCGWTAPVPALKTVKV